MTAPKPAPARGFRLQVQAVDTDTYALRVEETNGTRANTTIAAALDAHRVTTFGGALRCALRESGHPPTILGPTRRKPIPLAEAAGVRLALTINAAGGLAKPARRLSVLEGVSAMSDEEAYYWYAKTTRPRSGTRALRALRILLADDDRTGITA